MREEAKIKSGFYPVPPEALGVVLPLFQVGKEHIHLLDPCAGEGNATRQILGTLGIPEPNAWVIELDADRGEACRRNMPEANTLAPCSYFGCKVGYHAFSMVYCNPPFDADPVNGRVEVTWLKRATPMLVDKGIMLLVCPEKTTWNHQFQEYVKQNYEWIAIIPFPAAHRNSGEVFVVGEKREWRSANTSPHYQGVVRKTPTKIPLPLSAGSARYWQKTSLTPEEIQEALTNSPLNKQLASVPKRPLPRPPLQLTNGHLALLVSCGELDGIVRPDNGPAHVIRGVARKVRHIVSEDKQIDVKDQQSIVTRVEAERIQLVVRMLCGDGEIVDLT